MKGVEKGLSECASAARSIGVAAALTLPGMRWAP